ncbi:MAG TPA: hypothetical protein DDY14_05690 [Chromatiaceae bacterium]|nr:MAG: hypothetical protein N838_08950 [Thiohalocapsa sp. PB-PSB1]HBG94811.1 hypothetical protein [Chromatiaceae bacterium]
MVDVEQLRQPALHAQKSMGRAEVETPATIIPKTSACPARTGAARESHQMACAVRAPVDALAPMAPAAQQQA